MLSIITIILITKDVHVISENNSTHKIIHFGNVKANTRLSRKRHNVIFMPNYLIYTGSVIKFNIISQVVKAAMKVTLDPTRNKEAARGTLT